jgi:hypothetical protein
MDDFGCFYSVQTRHSNLEKDNVRLRFSGFLDGLLPIRCLADDAPFSLRLNECADLIPPWRKVIDY